MRVSFFSVEDSIIIDLKDTPFDHGKEMDERRYLMFDAADELIAISFLGVSDGVDLADVPGIEGPALSQVLEEQGIKLLV